MMKSVIHNQSGNVLFMILIGIVLFGALSFAISNMMQSGAGNLTEEKAAIYAQELIDYQRQIKQAVQRVRISNECADTEISFENNLNAFYNHASGPRDECKIFHPDGGDILYLLLNENAMDTSFSSSFTYRQAFFTGNNRVLEVGTSNTELIASFLHLNEAVCSKVNDKLGLGEAIPIDDGTAGFFTGDYTPSGGSPDMGDEDASLEGKMAFCVQAGGASPFFAFSNVLIPR